MAQDASELSPAAEATAPASVPRGAAPRGIGSEDGEPATLRGSFFADVNGHSVPVSSEATPAIGAGNPCRLEISIGLPHASPPFFVNVRAEAPACEPSLAAKGCCVPALEPAWHVDGLPVAHVHRLLLAPRIRDRLVALGSQGPVSILADRYRLTLTQVGSRDVDAAVELALQVAATLVSFPRRSAHDVDATARTQRSRCPVPAPSSAPTAPDNARSRGGPPVPAPASVRRTDRRSLLACSALGPGLGWLGTAHQNEPRGMSWALCVTAVALVALLLASMLWRRWLTPLQSRGQAGADGAAGDRRG